MKTVSKAITNSQGQIKYRERTSSRAKRVSLTVSGDGVVIASRPWWVSSRAVECFVKSKTDWVFAKMKAFEQIRHNPLLRTDRETYLEYKEQSREFIESRVIHFNKFYEFDYNRIAIRNQRSLWGSCSAKSNLNFNYKLLFLPPAVADYIVVHELCHLRELNHSKNFWDLVAKEIPDYKIHRKKLRQLMKI